MPKDLFFEDDPFFELKKLLFNIIAPEDYFEHVESLAESLDEGIFMVNKSGIIILWNSKLEELVCSRKVAIGRHFMEFLPKRLGEDKLIDWKDAIFNRAILTGTKTEVPQYLFPHIKQPAPVFRLRVHPLESKYGFRLGAVAIFEDVSEKLTLEKQLIRAARTTSLAELGAAVAHEIRNPLNAISLNLQLLQEDLEKTGQNQENIRLSSMITEEIERLNRIIKNFLKFARMPKPKKIMTSLNDIVKATIDLLRPKAEKAGVRIVLKAESDCVIPIDPDLIKQTCINLSLNAIQVMEQQGNGTLTIEITDFKTHAILRFHDTGPGFPEGQAEKSFSLFFSTKKDGLGLGLPIANRIIEEHGGKLIVDNADTGGAEIVIYLPSDHHEENK